MDKLVEALNQMKDLLEKGIAPPMPNKAPALPSIQTPPVPSMKPKVPKKMPGVKPASTKDPKKMAEQLKNPSKTKGPKIEMLKFEKNGQWTLY